MAQHTHDIEDVLSSIRRLVANDAGQVQTASEAAQAARPVPEGPTLVLDAAQRVTEPEDPFQMIRTLAQEERDGRDAEHFTDAVSEEVAGITRDLTEAFAHQAMTTVAPEAAQPGPAEADESMAGDRAATEPEEEADPLAGFADDYAEDTDYEAAAPAQTPDDAATAADAPARSGGLGDIAARAPGDEALRDLIAEIVRQELAGELGERITRNVRKLVRREIRQTLASDDFD